MYIIHKQEDLVNLEKCFINVPNDAITCFINHFSKCIVYPSFVIHNSNTKYKFSRPENVNIIGPLPLKLYVSLSNEIFNDCKYFIPRDTIIKNIVFTCYYWNIIDFHFANFNEILNKHETFLLFLKGSTDKNSLIDMFNTDVMFVISTYYRAICQ